MIPSPSHLITALQHEQTLSRINAFVDSTKSSPDARDNGHALYAIHPPGHYVHGTVILIHGITSNTLELQPLSKYLFENNFNVYLPPLPGHAFTSDHFPATVLRENLKEVQRILKTDEFLQAYFADIEKEAWLTPVDMSRHEKAVERIKSLVKENMEEEQGAKVINALKSLSQTEDGEKLAIDIDTYFQSDHERYETYAVHRLKEIEALPGPLFAVGYSMGGVQTLNLAANTGCRHVIIAPFFGTPEYGMDKKSEITLGSMCSLDVFKYEFYCSIFGRNVAAAIAAGGSLNRTKVYETIRRGGESFWIISDGDNIAEPKLALKYFKQRVEKENCVIFRYPEETELGHDCIPLPANPYSAAQLQEILRFLLTGEVRNENLLKTTRDPNLPDVNLKSLLSLEGED